jgi:hypothetical protein
MKFASCKSPREGSAGAIGSYWNFGLRHTRRRDVYQPTQLCENHVSRGHNSACTSRLPTGQESFASDSSMWSNFIEEEKPRSCCRLLNDGKSSLSQWCRNARHKTLSCL